MSVLTVGSASTEARQQRMATVQAATRDRRPAGRVRGRQTEGAAGGAGGRQRADEGVEEAGGHQWEAEADEYPDRAPLLREGVRLEVFRGCSWLSRLHRAAGHSPSSLTCRRPVVHREGR